MKTTSKQKFVVAVFLAGIALLLNFTFRGQMQSASDLLGANVLSVPTQQQEQVVPGLPVRLKIPEINVDATIEYVSLAANGAVDVPKDQKNVAWYNLGPRPGAIGASVITGHYGWQNKKGSAFDRLFKLRKGDKIYVEDDKGQTITFVVHGLKRYAPDAEASEVFLSNDDKAHLNLITCEGTWHDETKSYDRRLVIFADRE